MTDHFWKYHKNTMTLILQSDSLLLVAWTETPWNDNAPLDNKTVTFAPPSCWELPCLADLGN